MSSHLLSLPSELQEQIFFYCSVCDLKNLACCNSVFNQTVKHMLWSTVKISWGSLMCHDFLHSSKKKLENLRYTRNLRFARRIGLNKISDGKSVLAATNYVDTLRSCNADVLSTLFVEETFIDADTLKFTCSTLRKLKKLTITDCHHELPASSFAYIADLHDLTELNLYSTSIDDTSLLTICDSLVGLKSLNVGFTEISDEGFEGLRKLGHLEELNISFTRGSELGMSHLSGLTSLQVLSVEGSKVVDADLLHIGLLPNLKVLNISSCKSITDIGLSYVCCMPNLKILNINYTKVTKVGIQGLVPMKQLQILKCNFWMLTKHLRGLLSRVQIIES